MQWMDAFRIGVDKIDGQHQRLFELAGRLEESSGNPDASVVMGGTLKALVDYTCYHFKDEESLMSQIHFANLAEHQRRHHCLIDDVRKLLMDIKAGHPPSATDLIGFLNGWIVDHILKEDSRIGDAMKAFRHGMRGTRPEVEMIRNAPTQELASSLIRLKSLSKRGVISESAYAHQQRHLLDNYLREFSPRNTIEVIEELRGVQSLFDKRLVAEHEKAHLIEAFAMKVDLALVLNQDESPENSLRNVTIMHELGIIANHEHTLYRDYLLKQTSS